MNFRKAGMIIRLFVLVFFVVYANLAIGKEIHKDCLDCHKEKDSKELRSGINELCLKCHPLSTQRDHPVDIKGSIIPDNLPLDREGKITCITCHEPHGKTKEEKLLRMQFNTLCRECHKIY